MSVRNHQRDIAPPIATTIDEFLPWLSMHFLHGRPNVIERNPTPQLPHLRFLRFTPNRVARQPVPHFLQKRRITENRRGSQLKTLCDWLPLGHFVLHPLTVRRHLIRVAVSRPTP